MDRPTVSVVIPAHDAADWLDAAMRSALGQSLRDLEVIVVDDASRDATWQVAGRLAAADGRVRLARTGGVRGPAGPAAARNLGLGLARGRWVAFLDADDAFLPDRLARLVAAAGREGADLVADDLLRRDAASGELLGRHLGSAAVAAAPRPLTLAALVARDMPQSGHRAIGYLKPLVRRDLLARHGLRFEERVRGSEDLLFYAACVAAGARFVLLDEAHYLYSVRPGSLSRSYGIARQQALANRRIAALARRAEPQAAALVERRQVLLDRSAVAEEAAAGAWRRALSVIRWDRAPEAAANLRIVLGAARRRLQARLGLAAR